MTLHDYFVSSGSHADREAGMCAMEWVAYLAGESHSDAPQCVSPVLTRFCIAFNDRLPDDERQKLRPYLARTIGTRGDGRDDERVRMCREWLLATAFPLLLKNDDVAMCSACVAATLSGTQPDRLGCTCGWTGASGLPHRRTLDCVVTYQ